MKLKRFFLIFNILATSLFFSSCSRPGTQVWDDTKSCSRHMKRGLCSLGGKQGDSRQIVCREDFMSHQGNYDFNNDFIPLNDQERSDTNFSDFQPRQAKQSPGDPGSSVPGVEAFQAPDEVQLGNIFKTITFDYDSSSLKGSENVAAMSRIAKYMKQNPHVYIFVEGHCDQRGAEAYNLALGARRANTIRNALIKEGANPDHVFTISYGKERPIAFGNGEAVWSKNRRVEFKVYQR